MVLSKALSSECTVLCKVRYQQSVLQGVTTARASTDKPYPNTSDSSLYGTVTELFSFLTPEVTRVSAANLPLRNLDGTSESGTVAVWGAGMGRISHTPKAALGRYSST
eukprot:3931833-Rhodomonas_salina.1